MIIAIALIAFAAGLLPGWWLWSPSPAAPEPAPMNVAAFHEMRANVERTQELLRGWWLAAWRDHR